MTSKLTPFHLAVPVNDLQKAREFYREIIGCEEGRSSDHWVDFNLYGHQFVIHYKDYQQVEKSSNSVDGHDVPVPHFGVVLEWDAWHQLVDRMKAAGVTFAIEPYIRFKGEVGEQATMFFYDPCGNALEFKSFKDFSQIFAK